MYKVGEKLLCKHDYTNVVNDKLLTVGKYYLIHKYDPDDKLPIVWIGTNTTTVPLFITRDHNNYVWDIFYTKKELRKLKLIKLTNG
jgi:hypothetical protein